MLAANRDSFETVVVRPRFVWGAGDTTVLPTIVELVRSGRFSWIGGGMHRTSITHIDNTVAGARARGARGGVRATPTSSPTASRWCFASS